MRNVFIFYRIRIVPIVALMKHPAILWTLISSRMNCQKWFSEVLLKELFGPSGKKVLRKCGLKTFNGWKKKGPKQNMNYLSENLSLLFHSIVHVFYSSFILIFLNHASLP